MMAKIETPIRSIPAVAFLLLLIKNALSVRLHLTSSSGGRIMWCADWTNHSILPERSIAIFTCLIACLSLVQEAHSHVWEGKSFAQFRQLVTQFGPESSDDYISNGKEDLLFRYAEDAIIEGLNNDSGSPAAIAATVLRTLDGIANDVLSGWPPENRFHSHLLDLNKLLVIKFSIRGRTAMAAFGIPKYFGSAYGPVNTEWHRVGSDRFPNPKGIPHLDLYSLKAGPSGNPRFLSVYQEIYGDSTTSIDYEAY
jgi:hypothetical protein